MDAWKEEERENILWFQVREVVEKEKCGEEYEIEHYIAQFILG